MRTPNNVYILNKIGREVCCVGQTDEYGYGIRE
jgi:hypothetical protein